MSGDIGDLQLALARSDREEVNAVAARMLARGERLGERWLGISAALAHNGEHLLALKAAERGLVESGDDPRCRFGLASRLIEAGHPGAAIKIAAPLRGKAGAAAVEHFLGTCSLQLGAFDEARRCFESALHADPRAGATWLSLALLPSTDDARLLTRLLEVQTIGGLEVAHESPLRFAIGTVLDRLREYEAAFEAFTQGAELARQSRPYDEDADRREALKLLELSRRDLIELRAGEGGGGDAIFVSGLPRSGTTLVEQVLTSHSDVRAGSEARIGRIVARELGSNGLVDLKAYAARHGTQGIGALYLRLARQRFGAGRFVDKSLNLARMAGVYSAALPQAPMIWLDRDPLDVAWSNYRTWFARGADWSLSLPDMASHMALEERLAAHWRTVTDGRFRRLSYADLVTEPEATIGLIADHCGLIPQDAMFSPHETARAVTSASFVQVRRPINREGLGSAQPYARHLAPLLEALHVARRELSDNP